MEKKSMAEQVSRGCDRFYYFFLPRIASLFMISIGDYLLSKQPYSSFENNTGWTDGRMDFLKRCVVASRNRLKKKKQK